MGIREKLRAFFRVTLGSRKNWFATAPLRPVSADFGLERGKPVDRRYIEAFLSAHSERIHGTVVEVSERTYTRRFGGARVEKSLVLHVDPAAKADITCDLATGEGVPLALADCLILTQTLPFIYDVHSAVRNAVRMLKPGGTLLVTAPGITQISALDRSRWGQYWSFTEMSLRRLLEAAGPADQVEVRSFGNVKVAIAFLLGLVEHELDEETFCFQDPAYPLIVAGVLRKPAG